MSAASLFLCAGKKAVFIKEKRIVCPKPNSRTSSTPSSWPSSWSTAVPRHAAKGATAAHGNCLTRLFPPLERPGCGARIARRARHGACALRPLPLLRLAASAAGGARLCSLRQNFTANRALGREGLAHNLPQNFPVCVAVVGTCPPTATIFNFFNSLRHGHTTMPFLIENAGSRFARRAGADRAFQSSRNTGSSLGCAPVAGSMTSSRMSAMQAFQRSTTALSACVRSANATPRAHS